MESIETKRIAMFSVHSDPLASLGSQEAGGQNVYIRYLAEELAKLNWAVDIYTRWDSPYKKRIAHISKNARVIRLRGGPESYMPKSELFKFLPEIFDGFLTFNNFENPYLLFHGHYWDGGNIAVQASMKFEKPMIENFHSLGITRMETRKKYLKDTEEFDYFAKRLNAENDIIRASSKIICLAGPEKEDLIKFYGCPQEKIEVIPGGVNLKNWSLAEKQKAREYLNIRPEEFVILFVGRFEWRKGIGTLLEAGKILSQKIPNLKILIVGGKIYGRNKNMADFKEYARLSEMAKKMGLDQMVIFIGSIEHRALPNFFSSADIFVIPSYYEPFGLVALEGMANRLPVIASSVGGLAAIIEDNENGLLFSPMNSQELSEKIMAVYSLKELAYRLAEKGHKDVQKYSWSLIAERISGIYSDLIAKKNNSNENIANSAI